MTTSPQEPHPALLAAIGKHLKKLRDALRGEIAEVRDGAAQLRAEHAESRRRIAALEERIAEIGERQ